MGYREYPAPAPIRALVECAWTNEFDRPTTVDILPDGCMDLIWTGEELLVAGPDTAPHPYRPAGRRAAGLRFAPGRLPALLGLPAAALLDQRVPLAALHPRVSGPATAELTGGADPAPVLAALAERLPGAAPDAAVAAVLRHTRFGRSVGATADALGWTTRSLHRRCLDWFGYGPSVLRRVLRFRDASALLHAGIALAEVAARTGYADQPHLSREVRALSGRPPGQLGRTARTV